MSKPGLLARLVLETYNQTYLIVYTRFSFLWPVVDIVSHFFVTFLRLGAGLVVAEGVEKCDRPQELLILYDLESDGECRLVRETLSVLDLDVLCYPCPKECMEEAARPVNAIHRGKLQQEGGLLKLPLLVDKNKSVKIYTARDIIAYLWKNYGQKAVPPRNYVLAHSPVYAHISLFLCQAARPCVFMGMMRAPARYPKKPLELWGFEPSPYVRRVREVLAMLELPYISHSVAKRSLKRPAFRREELDQIAFFRSKPLEKVQVPMLKDPNNDHTRLLESKDIVSYLVTRYQTFATCSGTWMEAKAGPIFAVPTASFVASLIAVMIPAGSIASCIKLLYASILRQSAAAATALN